MQPEVSIRCNQKFRKFSNLYDVDIEITDPGEQVIGNETLVLVFLGRELVNLPCSLQNAVTSGGQTHDHDEASLQLNSGMIGPVFI